jgi:hypothetical protein
MTYTPAIWRGYGPERPRWAVLGPTGCYTFPSRYGYRAAVSLARAMNASA